MRALPLAAVLVCLGTLAPFVVASVRGDGRLSATAVAESRTAPPLELIGRYDLTASEACLGRRTGLTVYRILPGEVASYVFDARTEGALMVISPAVASSGTIGVSLLFQASDAAADRVAEENRPNFERQGRVVLAWGRIPTSDLRQTVVGCLRSAPLATA